MSLDPNAIDLINSTAVVVAPKRRRLTWMFAVAALLVAGGTGAWAWESGFKIQELWEGKPPELALVEVDEGTLPVYLTETGTLESGRNTSIKCMVESLIGTVGGASGNARSGSTGSSSGQSGGGGMGSGGGGSASGGSGSGSGGGSSTAKAASTSKGGTTTSGTSASAKAASAASKSSAATKSTSTTSAATADTATIVTIQRPTIQSFSYTVVKHVPLRGASTKAATKTATTASSGGGGMGGGGGGGGGRGGGGGGGGRGGGGGGGGGGQDDKAGSTRIISLLNEGTEVQAGQVVALLDSSAFGDELQAQKIRWTQAKAWVDQAKSIYDVGQITYRQFLEGIYPQDLQRINQYITTCEIEVDRAKKAEAWSRETRDKKYRAAAQYEADRKSLEKAELALHEALGMKERLVKYSMPRLEKTLQAKLESIKSDMLAQEAAFGVEDDRLRRLEKNVAACTLRAPREGILVYSNQQGGWGQNKVTIAEGITVREGQTLFDLPDPKFMRVKVKVNESKMASVRPGQKAHVVLDAFPDKILEGIVAEVTPIPALLGRFTDVRVYTAIVNLDTGGFEGLKPGMSAEVSFFVTADAKTTRIPIQAVRWEGGRAFAAVAARVGGATKWDWRPIEVGEMNEIHAEVVKGLAPGEKVVADPATLLPAPDPGAIKPDLQTASQDHAHRG
jgi:HlyD family secretion protein